MNREILDFVTYCISKLAQHLKLSQQDVYARLKQSGILYEYIVPSYDVLHTFGSRYLIQDLTDYMREKGEFTTMTDETGMTLRATKIANIISDISELYHTSLEEATDMYYSSTTANLIEEGVAELQCRSGKYLATVIWDEIHENKILLSSDKTA